MVKDGNATETTSTRKVGKVLSRARERAIHGVASTPWMAGKALNLPKSVAVAPAQPPKVDVSVSMPQNTPTEPAEREEKSPMWFWDMLQAIPREQWGNVYSVMAWREEPKVPGVPGAKGFLFEAFEPISLSYFKERYGGGKFKAVLQKNSKFQTTHIFDIEGAPKYDLSREMPHAHTAPANGAGDNALLKQFVDVLREELARSREANSAPNPATDEAISLVSRASEKAMDIVANRANNGGGTGNSTQQLSELVNIVKGIMPAQTGGGIADTLLKALVDKLLTPVDPLAQVTSFLTIFEKIDAIRGTGGGEGKPKDWRAMLAEGIVQKGPEILKEIRETVVVNRDTAAERRAAAEAIRDVETIRRGGAVPPTPAAPANGANRSAAAQHVPAGPLRTVPIDRTQPQAVAPQQVETPPAAPGMNATETEAVGKFMEQRIVQMVEDGRDAEDVVDFIEEIDPSMNDMLAQFSAEMETTFLAGRAIIGRATQLPNWNEFLLAAQKYIKEIRAEDAQIEAASAHVPA